MKTRREIFQVADLAGREIFTTLPELDLTMARVKILGFMGSFVEIEIYGSTNERQRFLKFDEIKYFEVAE